MAADGHLNFDTKLDEKGFSSGVKNLGNIAKGGLKILGSAVAGVTTVMGAGVVAGMKYNSSMENYFANFETMLGSAEAATQHVQQLKEFASKTPFEMSDLANASQTLLSFGTDAEKTMPVMKQLGDISLGNKEKFSSLALVYGQVSSQGKLMGQDLMQMINAGFNPLLEISEHTGESMESLKEKMSKGQIGIEEIDQALKWATEDGGRFAGGMEKASQTMSGLISTLKDNAMSLLGEVVQPISDSMTKTLLPAALDAISQLTTAFREDGINGLIEAGGQILSNLLLGIANGLPSILETSISVIQSFVESINANLPSFITAGGQILSSLMQGVVELLPSLGQLGLNIILQLGQAIIANAPQLIPKGVEVLLKFAQGIINNLPQIAETGLKVLVSLAQGIANSFPKVIELVPKLINEFCAHLDSFLPKILETGIQILITLGKGILQSIPTIISNAGEIVKAILNVITHFSLFSQGKDIINGLGNGLKSVFSTIKSHIQNLINLIKNPFKIDWGSIGSNIVSGIANGIRNGAHAIAEAAKNAARSALNAAKNFLGIHSPSRVFRDQVGKYMALGMGVGFEKNVPTDEMEKSITGAVDRIQGAVSTVHQGVPNVTGNQDNSFSKNNGKDEDVPRKVELHIHTNLDGKEVAHEIVEYVDDELGQREEFKERGVY